MSGPSPFHSRPSSDHGVGSTDDVLRSLPDWRAVRSSIQQYLRASTTTPSAFLTLTLDRFELVTDSLGYDAADDVLGTVTVLLLDAVRAFDLVTHIGGDQFAVWLPNIEGPQHACALAENIYATLNRPLRVDGHTVFAPPSIGLVIGTADYDWSNDVLRDANAALNVAKAEPQSSYVVFEHDMRVRVHERRRLDTALRTAVKRGEFVPFFQPIVSLSNGKLHGFEVLARWRHPERGIHAPEHFLNAAEATGLIVPIGHQVIRRACEVVSRLQAQKELTEHLPLTANFSRQEFLRPDTVDFLSELFERYDVSPQSFTMEISERTVAGLSDADISVFDALKDLGVTIVLDDFGTGFSSLQSLRRLPVDGLKIDRDLLAETRGRSWDRRLVNLVVEMGHTLDQTVIAEGIETIPHLEGLRSMQCGYGQGFLFARPVPGPQLGALLDEPSWMQFWTN